MSGADSGPSLDLRKNNSTGPVPADSGRFEQSDLTDYGVEPESSGSGRYDCREVYRNFEFEGPDGATAPFRCDSWACVCCGYRMRMNLVEEIERVCTSNPAMSRLLTLTLDPATAPADQDEQHRYLTERWNAFRTRLKREIGDFSFIWVREEQDNGLPHIHAVVSRYLPQGVVSTAWSQLGGGEIVDIRKIDRVEKTAHYVGKYLTEDALSDLPKGIRRYGSSADIDLDVRGSDDSDGDWDLLMDDHEVPDGPVRRGVDRVDFVRQREYGGPLPPPRPPPRGS